MNNSNSRSVKDQVLQASNKFTAKNRLKKRNDFIIVKKSGHKAYGKFLILLFLPRSAQELDNLHSPYRLGLIVSKKVSKKAVQRNLVKRRLREIFRLNYQELQSGDFLVIAKQNALKASYQELEKDFIKACHYAFKTCS